MVSSPDNILAIWEEVFQSLQNPLLVRYAEREPWGRWQKTFWVESRINPNHPTFWKVHSVNTTTSSFWLYVTGEKVAAIFTNTVWTIGEWSTKKAWIYRNALTPDEAIFFATIRDHLKRLKEEIKTSPNLKNQLQTEIDETVWY